MAWIHLCFRAWLDRVSEDGGDGDDGGGGKGESTAWLSFRNIAAPSCRPKGSAAPQAPATNSSAAQRSPIGEDECTYPYIEWFGIVTLVICSLIKPRP